jgi:glyoxylate utilization-related uncharacterized protein
LLSNATCTATPGEVFGLKKLLPQTLEFDVNFHVMDFNPGEHLNVKEIHYNQHGGAGLCGARTFCVFLFVVAWMKSKLNPVDP